MCLRDVWVYVGGESSEKQRGKGGTNVEPSF